MLVSQSVGQHIFVTTFQEKLFTSAFQTFTYYLDGYNLELIRLSV